MIKKLRVAPLSSGFMLVSILGFLITIIYTYFGSIDITWGVTFLLVFTVMFIASIISMTAAPVEEELFLDNFFDYQRKLRARKKGRTF